jgi:DNA-binding Lrp family transcriptional regulator
MDIQTVKLNLLQKLMGVSNAALLEKIEKILDKEMIVGYTVDGRPLTKAAYDNRLKKAEEQISAGRFITQEDLEKESENW